jgi:hypothetical protein
VLVIELFTVIEKEKAADLTELNNALWLQIHSFVVFRYFCGMVTNPFSS